MECQYCESYRTSSKRYVKRVGEIEKHSRQCPETKKIVTSITESCECFTLAKYIYCTSMHNWKPPKKLCIFKPYDDCRKCLTVKVLMDFLHLTRRLRKVPPCIKMREYPKVNIHKKPKSTNGTEGSNGNGRRLRRRKFTALDAALIAADANSYLSISADEPEYELVSPVTPLDLLLQKERLEGSLSREAKTVVKLVLSSPGKVSSPVTGNVTKGSITTHLRSNGWAHKVISETFRELRTVAMSF